ncbi:HigA family addiction module antitoxin [Chlorobium phaeobacteroides]|uniref:Plasmid maintenance system antidote protein, XRE family n=1 Tax=Chlorobium phaeobacteroides (strain DSM 266 / SMG 266 / 2430) TaxID=290317 RepID=A1BHT8_CHLPD|nr:HigA family addiction module antitoxin [Chlorobium phaeobacteroides]ABL65965.1 plasmid maintenance system antidote protein, XRE family [Chlorobium phaeobacteroides DSM 266]
MYKTKEDIAIAREIISCPGDTLAEHLEYTGMTQAELAERMGRPKKTINEIIQGKAQITPETALQLERVVSIPADFWMELERRYRLRLAEIDEAETLLQAKEWANRFPCKAMKNKGWIAFDGSSANAGKALLSFFNVASPEVYETFYHGQVYATAYRMSEKNSKDPYAVTAWLRQGERQAETLQVPDFDRKAFEAILQEIKKLVISGTDDFFPELQEQCRKAGVKVVHTPCLPKAPLHGSTRWVKGIPLIQLSNRLNRNDIFWFTFFHEAAHILKHNKKDVFVEGMEYSCNGKEKEAEANDFAEEILMSRQQEKEFIESGSFKKDDIRRFAAKIGTHPAIVTGRLANRRVLKQQMGNVYGFFKNVELKG